MAKKAASLTGSLVLLPHALLSHWPRLLIAQNKCNKHSGFIQGIGVGTQHPMGVKSHLQKERCLYLQGPASPSHPGVSMADPHTSILPCIQSELHGPLCLQEEVQHGPILGLHSTATSSVFIAPTGQSL